MNKIGRITDLNSLREQARQILRDHEFHHTIAQYHRGELELESLLEELHVYHAELIIQQEALRESYAANERALARFVRLYYDLPLPALLVSKSGLVTDNNAAAASLLALDRQLFPHLACEHHTGVLENALFEAQTSGTAVRAEVSLRGLGRRRLIVDLMLIRLPGPSSEETEFVCTIVDQSERISQLNAQQLISDVSSLFVNSGGQDFDRVMTAVLGQLGQYFQVERSHLFRMTEDRHAFELTHAWPTLAIHAKDEGEMARLACDFPWWCSRIQQQEAVQIPDRSALPPEAASELADMQRRAVRSRLALPLVADGQVIGALELDALAATRLWNEAELRLLRVITERIASMLLRHRAEHELLASETRYRQVSTIMSDVAYSCVASDGGGYAIDWVTDSIQVLTGYSRHEIVAMGCWSALVLTDDLSTFATRISRLAPNQTSSCELRLRRRDGTVRWIRCSTECVLEGEQTGTRRLYGGLVDITERKIRDTEIERLALVLEQSPSIVLITDLTGRIEYVNQRFCDVTGYSREEIRGQPQDHLAAQETGSGWPDAIMQRILKGRTWYGECRGIRKSGEPYWEQALITPLRDEHGAVSHLVKLAEDVSDKKALSERLTYLTHYDPLTGLPNRALMLEHIGRALAAAQHAQHGLALLSVDLDKLKFINDSLGHAAGDRLLQEVARRLQSLLGTGDSLARFGGDNFVLLAARLKQAQDSVHLAEEINRLMDEPIALGEGSARITACTGIALYPEDAHTADELIGHADVALHKASTEGRGLYRFYTPALNRQLLEQFQLEQALRQGMERDELRLSYQPRVDIRTGEILSLEALIRWQHPEQGMIPPSRFIPVAESTGLILEIGPIVLREACRQLRRWQAAGVPTVPIAVNLSAKELYQEDLAHRIRAILEEACARPGELEFEITESAAMRSIDQAVAILTQLRADGFALSIDDFGTGYASLNYLNRLPMQAIKIDRSFLADIGAGGDDSGQSAAIVKAIIGLGSNLGLHIIAEGVETEAQRAFLIDHGCHVAQGYLFAWPRAPQDIEPLLRAGRVDLADEG